MKLLVRFLSSALLVLGVLSLGIAAEAQTASTAVIVGTVTDQSSGVLPGVSVKLTNVATGASQTITSNDAGQYTFPNVVPGTYTVEVTKQGFRKSSVRGLVVDVGKSYMVNIAMELGEVSQSVVVEAGARVELQTTSAQVGSVINQQEMELLPTLQHRATELIT